jgi:hypothetical protein
MPDSATPPDQGDANPTARIPKHEQGKKLLRSLKEWVISWPNLWGLAAVLCRKILLAPGQRELVAVHVILFEGLNPKGYTDTQG